MAGLLLWIRLIPPNFFIGFRTRLTLSTTSIWYDANALAGKLLFLFGVFLISLAYGIHKIGEPSGGYEFFVTLFVFGLPVFLILRRLRKFEWELSHRHE